jgi:class 3 adenylate cyclase
MTRKSPLAKRVELPDWLEMFRREGERRARPLVIGATGHLLLTSVEEENVTRHLERGLLPGLIGRDANLGLTVLTGLAPGADLLLTKIITRWLAKRSIPCEIVGLLPVPPGTLVRDWQEKALSSGLQPDDAQVRAIERDLRRAITECSVLVDLLGSGDLRTRLDDLETRQRQYRRLGAVLAEQTDVLIAVLRPPKDGSGALPGGTAEVVEWRRQLQSVPQDISTLSLEQRISGDRHRQLIVLDPSVPYRGGSSGDAAESVYKRANEALKAGNYLQCYDTISRARARGVDSRALQYLTILALANAGSTRLALRRYVEFEEAAELGEDWLALKARLLKDLAFRGGPASESLFLQAAEAYESAFVGTGGYFSAVNAASMYCLGGQRASATKLAREVSELLQKVQPQSDEDRYYWQVTQAEASLLQGDAEGCKVALRAADELQLGNVNARSRTRYQLRQVALCMGFDPALADALALPSVIYVRRLGPKADDGEAERALREQIGSLKPMVFLALLGLGELRLAEVCLDLGVPLYLCLADERTAEVQRWRRLHGEATVERLGRCLLRAHEICSARGFMEGEDQWCARYVDSMAFGLSLLAARRLATAWKVLAVGKDGRPLTMREDQAASAGFTATGQFSNPPAPAKRRYVGLIFADFVGFSALPDDVLPRYWNEVMGAMGLMLKAHSASVLFRHTWGDALHIVTKDAISAASIATSIRSTLERLRATLTGDLARLELRLSVHYAPAFIGRDPIEDADTFFGSQLSFAARIEPVTPPGTIFVTESFAAQLMLEGPEQFALEYAGELELAKSYGQYRLFSLRRRNAPDFGKTAELLLR